MHSLKHLSTWLILLTVIMASGVVHAKIVPGSELYHSDKTTNLSQKPRLGIFLGSEPHVWKNPVLSDCKHREKTEVSPGCTSVQLLYGDDLIRQSQDNANEKYYLYDGLGSTRALTDLTGATTDTYDYEAFGSTLNQTGTTTNNYLFTGEQYDQTLDQQYLRARYYDPHIARFTQQNTWMGNSQDPVTLHKYLYANIDPVNNIDPSGEFSIGSMMTAINVASNLVTTAQAGYSLFQIATGEEEVTAKQIGSAIIIGMLGKNAGKLIGLVAGKAAKECLLKNSFVEGTLVSTENGLISIENVEIGDNVWAYDEETGENSLQEVVHLISGEGEKELVKINLVSGDTILATMEHPFYVPQLDEPWVDARKLSSAQVLFNENRSPAAIIDVVQETSNVKVYNLAVSNNHTYYVSKNPVLVHNCGFVGKSVLKILTSNASKTKRVKRGGGNYGGKTGGYVQAEAEFKLMIARFGIKPGSLKKRTGDGYSVTLKDGSTMTLRGKEKGRPTIYLDVDGTQNKIRYYQE